jgi:hypothetical protein
MIAQAATAQAEPAPRPAVASPASASPSQWSIQVPVPDEPCVQRSATGAKPSGGGGRTEDKNDIVICSRLVPLPSQKLPYPNEIVPDHAMPSNPNMTGAGALQAVNPPCSGCDEDSNSIVAPMLSGAVDLAKRAFAKKPDKKGRVAIDLSDTPPDITGKVLP